MSSHGKKKTLLLADDDPHILEAWRIIMTGMGFDILAEARNGREAVELFRVHQPDLTLLDIEMPEMNGIQALREIRAKFPDARIAMLTSLEPRETLDNSLESGAVDFIRKGQAPERLMAEIRAIEKKFFD